jgi:hypothetical protein
VVGFHGFTTVNQKFSELLIMAALQNGEKLETLYMLSSYVLNINLHQCMTDECLEVMYLHICNVVVHAPKLRKLPVIETDYTEPTDTKLFS